MTEQGLRAGVRGAVALAEALGRHVRVDLRRAEARVAEQLLHAAEIRPAVEQVRRRGVSEAVRAGHCTDGPSCVHLGARVDGAYVSPLLFLGGGVPSVLLPTRR